MLSNQLDHMLKAGSVAIIGASGRPGSVGEQTLRQLHKGGFEGAIYPVNPGYDSLLDLRCFRDINDVGAPLDLAVLAVSNEKLETETEKALQAGARSLVIFASCHGVASDGTLLRDRIAALANAAGAPICGGNGMGFVNVEENLRICGFYQPEVLHPGGIAFLSHSGSLFSAMLHNKRGLAFNVVVSTGLEQNTRMNDYLSWVLRLDSTTVVALFMETVRDPDGFMDALRLAHHRQIPIVALKVGASKRGRAAVATHSDAIAGEDAVYEAVFEAFDVHRVESMDEMVDTVELMATVHPPPHRGGLGAVLDSGGERALLIDTAERVGVPLPDLTETTVEKVSTFLDPGLEAANPIDAWGTGRDSREVFIGCLQALAEDPNVAVVAFSVDLTSEESLDQAYGLAALEVAARTEKPVIVLAHLASAVDPIQAEVVRAGGVPVLYGTETGLRAIRHLLERAQRSDRPMRAPRITATRLNDWADPWGILENYGIAHARTIAVSNVAEAERAAASLGYPVVLKTAMSDHKTDVGGVVAHINDVSRLRSEYEELSRRLGPTATVSEHIGPGVEIGLGMIADPLFGPVVLVSAGGTLIELLGDRVAFLPPIDLFGAHRVIERLAVYEILRGHRGSAPCDVDALADVITRFSELAVDAQGVASIDVNPVIVGPKTAVAVDVLVRR